MKKQLLSVLLICLSISIGYAIERDFKKIGKSNKLRTLPNKVLEIGNQPSFTCPTPVNLAIDPQSITTTSATLFWSETANATQWDVLLLAAGAEGQEPQLPTEIPTANPLDRYYEGVTGPQTFTPTDLNPGTIYYYYVRSVCGPDDKSDWSGPIVFNTVLCSDEDKCVYQFKLKNPSANSWNGARVQLRQNGIVVATLGAAYVNTVAPLLLYLCNNVPFDVYWSIDGESPEDIGLEIINPFNDVVYTKLPGEGVPSTVLYSDATLGNCNPPTCLQPQNLSADYFTTTSAFLYWNQSGSASQWEVFVAPVGTAPPVNYTPLNSGIPNYYLTDINNSSITIPDLQPGTDYVFYVRSICSDTDISTWTLLNPGQFTTIASNDECQNAIEIPVNVGMQADVLFPATTKGATPSAEFVTCGGFGDRDVWYKFVASSPIHIIKCVDISGGSAEVGHTLFSGNQCDTMTQLYCMSNNLTSVATGLTMGETYYLRFYTYGNNANKSIKFNIEITSSEIISVTNDGPNTATPVTVNNNNECVSATYGALNGATASNVPHFCTGNPNDDVWYSFVATSQKHIVSIFDVAGTTTNINHAIYSGTPENLVFKHCSANNSLVSNYQNYVVGETYYIRVWSYVADPQIVVFGICIKSISSCENPTVFCSASIANPYIFENTIGVPNNSQVACLGSIPNPTYFSFQVAQSGKLVFDILQNTNFDGSGNPIGLNRDVDFVAWGPFSTLDSCDEISFLGCTGCPNNTLNPNFYPYENIVDCSYDANYNETLTVPNAIAGEYYILLMTNFNGSPGYIRLRQTNLNEEGAGATMCADNLQLVAFIDQNNNGSKDPNESNFTYGSFTYQKNDEMPVNVSSPLGIYSVFDSNPNNQYDFGYQIDSEFSTYYTAVPTNYNDINIVLENGTQHLYFPITITQDYTDVNVSLVPLTDPRPGFLYANKIIYKNTGTTAASGTLTFSKDENVTIESVNQVGIVNTPSGFSYAYTDLLPSETRSFDVNMMVPSIPTVNIDDVLTNNVTSTIPNADINVLNNTNTISQVVIGAYDPNDKIEAHGESIDFNSFTQDDFLVYTIRFQNTGTANAINVRIEDELDAQLDETSVRMISSSHDYTMQRINSKLIWTFNNIQLPPQITNEAASNGYVTFKIKPNAGFALGDIIPNFAEIYFDTNPAIITNTFNSTFEEQLATPEFSSVNLLIYPNPSNGLVYINTQNTTENLKEINLYDVLGKTILSSKNLSSRQSTIDVSSLAKGIYMIEITTENNFKQTKKLVVN